LLEPFIQGRLTKFDLLTHSGLSQKRSQHFISEDFLKGRGLL